MRTLATILGARPQFIKAAALSNAIQEDEDWTEVLIHTGQHFDENMSDVFFEELSIQPPEYHLGVHSLGHGAMTGRMMEKIEEILIELKPDIVCLYGDTNSTVAGALVAAKLHIPVAHVEAGLRSFNRKMPEELNRIVTDHLSDLLFAPTDLAVENLIKEGIPQSKIFKVGDVMFDATKLFSDRADKQSHILEEHGLQPKTYYLATIHRAENTNSEKDLKTIFRVLEEVGSNVDVVLPLHPRTKQKIEDFNIEIKHVKCIAPVGYLDMITLQKNATLIITDSGGVQKEAFFHAVPCVTVREETEWVELVDLGWNTLAPAEKFADVMLAITRNGIRGGENAQPYGDGSAAYHIVNHMSEYYK